MNAAIAYSRDSQPVKASARMAGGVVMQIHKGR